MSQTATRSIASHDGVVPRMTEQPMFHRVLRADPLSVRQVLIDVTRRFGPLLASDRLSRLELALAEVLNNIVEHGYGTGRAGLIHLSIVPGRKGLSCAVADDGPPLPGDCLTERATPLTPALTGADPSGTPQDRLLHLPEGGFGWLLIQGLTQNLCYFRENNRNILAFFLPDEGEANAATPPVPAAAGGAA
ncbi:ATP-binding protein [Paracoccus sp. p4-l81]|uniref:ATP-binding protein n=1 Tax=unclassified Paracoccus (in: a-proteobacteria) TaxID=2688777 RepID=UPI0035B7F140